jgi:hypothetical protein
MFSSSDFGSDEIKQLLGTFCDQIAYSFGDSAEDNKLNDVYRPKFKILQEYFGSILQTKLVKASLRQLVSNLSSNDVLGEKPKAKYTILDIDSHELSIALTLKDHNLFSSITPKSLSLHLWSSKTDSSVENDLKVIQDAITNFNTICYWVATEVCTQPGKNLLTQKLKIESR